MMKQAETFHVTLPDLGEGIGNAVVAEWYVQEGSPIKQDSDLVELVTDKASFCVPAPYPGIVQKIYYPAGAKVKVGAILLDIQSSSLERT